MRAAGLGIQRVDHAAGAAGEHRAVEEGGGSEGDDVAGKSESPLEFQLAQLADAETGLIARHVTRVIIRWTPAIPVARARACHRALAGGTEVLRCLELPARHTQKVGDGLAFIALQRIRDAHHQTEVQGAKNTRGGQFLQGLARRNARRILVVTGGAAGLVDFFARRRRRQHGGERQDERQGEGNG